MLSMKNKLFNILVFFISIYIPLLGTEIFFLFSDKIGIKSKSINLKIKDSDSKRNEKIRDKYIHNLKNLYLQEKIKAKSEGYIPTYYPEVIKIYEKKWIPIGGKINADTYFCNEGYGLTKYKSDRFGLRNEDKKWDLIKSKPYNMFIGDSFVHGACVDNHKTIPYMYELLSKENTLNIGYGANNPYSYVAILNTFLKDIVKVSNQEAKIILIFHANDLCKNCESNEKYLNSIPAINKPLNLDNITANKGYLYKLNKSIKKAEKLSPKFKLKKENYYQKLISINLIKSIYRLGILTKTRNRLTETYKNLNSNYYYSKNGPSGKAIKTLSEICIKNCKPYVSFIPGSSLWYKNRYINNENYLKGLKNISNFYNVNFIDISNVIDPDNTYHSAPSGPHLSELGYKLVTEEIFNKIKN